MSSHTMLLQLVVTICLFVGCLLYGIRSSMSSGLYGYDHTLQLLILTDDIIVRCSNNQFISFDQDY